MSLDERREPRAPAIQNERRPTDAGDGAFNVEHPPALIGAAVLAAVFGIGVSQVHKNAKRGLYDAFKVTPALGPKCYSGILLARYLKGEPLYVPTFGRRKRA